MSSPSGAAQPLRRLFFALWPDEAARAELLDTTQAAVLASGGRPVPSANLHVTVAFLGPVPERRLVDVTAAAAELRQAPFRLSLNRIEYWPKPAVLCATPSELPYPAVELARTLWQLLGRRGLVPDSKPYRPHVTLARKVVKPFAVGEMRRVEWTADQIVLVESSTESEGALYTMLRRWPLRR